MVECVIAACIVYVTILSALIYGWYNRTYRKPSMDPTERLMILFWPLTLVVLIVYGFWLLGGNVSVEYYKSIRWFFGGHDD